MSWSLLIVALIPNTIALLVQVTQLQSYKVIKIKARKLHCKKLQHYKVSKLQSFLVFKLPSLQVTISCQVTKSPSYQAQTDIQTTHGHHHLETEPAPKGDSVKIYYWSIHILFFLQNFDFFF